MPPPKSRGLSIRWPVPTRRVEEKYWSHVAPRIEGQADDLSPDRSRERSRFLVIRLTAHEERVPVLASHPDACWPGDHPGRAFPDDPRTPASLKGS